VKAALDPAGNHALDDRALLEGLFQDGPGARTLGLVAGQARLPETVLDGIQRDFDLVADLDLPFAPFVLELLGGNDRLGLQAGGDDDDVIVDLDDQALDDRARTNLLTGKTLLKELCETF
jgi:hypothetical protein